MSAFDDVNDYMKRLEKIITSVGKYGNAELKDAEQYKQMVKKMCAAELKCQTSELLAQNVDNYADLEQADEVMATTDRTPIPDPTTTQRYKRFERKLADILGDDEDEPEAGPSQCDDDDIVMEGDIVYIDPITKKPLENPVRNKKCGHNYERDSIIEAIKLNQRLRCPMMGCKNRDIMTERDLIEDEELSRKLFRRKRQQQREEDEDD